MLNENSKYTFSSEESFLFFTDFDIFAEHLPDTFPDLIPRNTCYKHRHWCTNGVQ